MKRLLLALTVLCSLATPAPAQWQVSDHCMPAGRGAGTGFRCTAQAIFATVAAVNAATIPNEVTRIRTMAYFAAGQNSGADYAFHGAAAPSFGCYITSNAGGKFWTPINTVINDKMCGARVDGATDDTAAIQAMGTFVAASRPTWAVFTRGTRVISGANLWNISVASLDALNIVWEDAVFSLSNNQNVGVSSILFSFHSARNIKMSGYVTFNGNLVEATFAGGSITGSLPIRCHSDCSGFDNQAVIEVNNVGQGLSLSRRPAVSIDPYIAPIIVSGGTGFIDKEVVTLSAFPAGAGNPGVVLGTFIATVSAGAITALTSTVNSDGICSTCGYYPWDSSTGDVYSWPAPEVAQTGVPLTGGSGTGAIIHVYGRDADESTMTWGANLGIVRCSVVWRCIEQQSNGHNSTVDVKVENSYRAAVVYNVYNAKVKVTSRNPVQDQLIIGSFVGMPLNTAYVHFIGLPTDDPGCTSCNHIRIDFQSGTGQIYNLYITSDVDYGTATLRMGGHWIIEKQAPDGTDLTHTRSHILQNFTWNGRIHGYGDVNGGGGTSAIGGVRLSQNWTGERFSNFVFDNLTLSGGVCAASSPGFIYLDSRAFTGTTGLTIGNGFQSAAPVAYTAGFAGAWGTPVSPFIAAPNSSFGNKFTTCSAGGFVKALSPTRQVGSSAFDGTTSGTVTTTVQAAAGTYNWNYPTAAGTSGQPLLSGGGGAAAQTYGTLGATAGGTGITSGSSGGVLYFSTATTIAAGGTLGSETIVLGGGAGGAPTSLAAGTANQVLHGGIPPTWSAVVSADMNITTTACTNQFVRAISAGAVGTCATVNLASDVTGDLAFSNLTQGSALSVLGVTGNATADHASIAAGTDHNVLRRSGTALAFGSINLAQSGAVGSSVLALGNGGLGTAHTNVREAMATLKGVYVLAVSGASASVTGTTALTTLATVNVPANAMGANGRIRTTTIWTYTNSADDKTIRHQFGGNNFCTFTPMTTTASLRVICEFQNANATGTQQFFANNVGLSAPGAGLGFTSAANSTIAVDTTVSQNITFLGALENTADTITLVSYLVELFVP